MTVSLHNRRKLQKAIAGLLEGTTTAPDGKLTWKNVAAVAGVSKATADRAVDLRDDFRRRLRQAAPIPAVRPETAAPVRRDVDVELARLRREIMELKQATKVLHSVILALMDDNQRLSRRAGGDASARRGNAGMPTESG